MVRRVGPEGLTRPWREAEGESTLDLVQATDQGRRRAIALAVRDGVTVDEVVLPEVGDVDVADFAEVASSDDGGVLSSGAVRWDLTHDDEHPGWLELSWSVPQPVNTCRYRFPRGEFTPQDWSLQYPDPDGAWVTLAQKSDGSEDHFNTVETTALRIVVRRGGRWQGVMAVRDCALALALLVAPLLDCSSVASPQADLFEDLYGCEANSTGDPRRARGRSRARRA
ncbi:MAG: hypothetical protein AB7Y46_02920 [Armatimonadota bacterium]